LLLILAMSIACDLCDRALCDEESFYHCSECSQGAFDVCKTCYSQGRRCKDSQHKLAHRRIRGDAIVEAEGGNLIRYSVFKNCPGCSWDRAGRPYEDTVFAYDSPPNGSYIRVLDLLPGPQDQPLRYSLHYAQLSSVPRAQYIASECGRV
jgi:hypothetical protein